MMLVRSTTLGPEDGEVELRVDREDRVLIENVVEALGRVCCELELASRSNKDRGAREKLQRVLEILEAEMEEEVVSLGVENGWVGGNSKGNRNTMGGFAGVDGAAMRLADRERERSSSGLRVENARYGSGVMNGGYRSAGSNGSSGGSGQAFGGMGLGRVSGGVGLGSGGFGKEDAYGEMF